MTMVCAAAASCSLLSEERGEVPLVTSVQAIIRGGEGSSVLNSGTRDPEAVLVRCRTIMARTAARRMVVVTAEALTCWGYRDLQVDAMAMSAAASDKYSKPAGLTARQGRQAHPSGSTDVATSARRSRCLGAALVHHGVDELAQMPLT